MWTDSKSKKSSFWRVIFSYSTQQQWTIPWLDGGMQRKVDFIRQPAPTSSVARLRRSSKTLPKAKLAPKKSQSLFGDLLPVWTTIAFWIPEKPLHLKSMLSKSLRCTKNCNVCSMHWSTKRAQFLSMTTPDHTRTTNASRVEWIGLQNFAHLPYSPDLSLTNYHFFKHLDNFL